MFNSNYPHENGLVVELLLFSFDVDSQIHVTVHFLMHSEEHLPKDRPVVNMEIHKHNE